MIFSFISLCISFYNLPEKIKAESEVVFAELLRKLESIGDIDRL